MGVTASPSALIKGIFQIAVTTGKGIELRQHPIGQQGSPQVGVHHHSGGIDHVPEAGHGQPFHLNQHISNNNVRFECFL
jgi:hypothetical protein